MHRKLFSSTLVGLEGYPIEIEADVSQGLPAFTIVGLPDTSVQESRERIRSAVRNSKLPFPRTRVTVNLAPADIKKEGAYFDLPIALSLLCETLDAKTFSIPETDLILGELALNGSVRPINGALSFTLLAQKRGFKRIIIPKANVKEASLIQGVTIVGVETLKDAVDFYSGIHSKHLYIGESRLKKEVPVDNTEPNVDFSHISGHHHVKRAFEIAAAGGHHIAMVGSPGAGKTLLAKALPGILPPLSKEEIISLTQLYSAAGLLHDTSLIQKRPFRSPHHSASTPALVGGGSHAKPGEISLAHRGVLFLDEAAEFQKNVLDSLRQPLEDGVVTISRIRETLTYPSQFMLVLATNPCPCGYYLDEHRECTCTIGAVQKYFKKLSGPLLDRIDMHIHVPAVSVGELTHSDDSEQTRTIQQRVIRARARQKKILRCFDVELNSYVPSSSLLDIDRFDSRALQFLKEAAERLHLSARSYHRMLKLGLTISDLSEHDTVLEEHVAEALTYRPTNLLDV